MRRHLLLLGTGGPAAYSEYSLGQVAASCPVVLADTAAPSWARPYLDHHLVVDPSDVVATTASALDYAAAHGLGGVLTFIPAYLPAAARIAACLGERSESAAALAACTDRLAVRRALTRHRVPSVRWEHACSVETATSKADLIGYPVVLRPLTGSQRGWCAVQNADVPELYECVSRQATGAAGHPDGAVVLVEEDVDAPLVSAETVVLDHGDVRIVAVTRTSEGPPPARQVIRHCVYAHDRLLHNRMVRQQVARTVQALGLGRGVLRVEMKLTSRGPRVTDVSPHLAGDLIPLLVKRATGINLSRVAADLAVGGSPDLTPTRQRAAAVHFAYSSTSGYIRRIAVAAPSYQPLVDRIVLTQESGRSVASMDHAEVTDRLAHWVVLGATAANCHATLDGMVQDLALDLEPAFGAADHVLHTERLITQGDPLISQQPSGPALTEETSANWSPSCAT